MPRLLAFCAVRSEVATLVTFRPPRRRGASTSRKASAVDGEIEWRQLIERRQRNAEASRLLRGAFGGPHARHVQAAAQARSQYLQEGLRRRAGAEPEFHPILDEIQGLQRRGALQEGGIG